MIRRDQKDDMDRGQARATAHANRLQRQSGTRHRAVERSFFGLVGGAVWWEVQRRTFPLIWRHVTSYGTVDGEKL